jgi:hypothetical protein
MQQSENNTNLFVLRVFRYMFSKKRDLVSIRMSSHFTPLFALVSI